MITPSLKLLLSLKRGEGGPELTAHADPKTHGEPYALGYGHTGGIVQGQTCTTAQAEWWLNEDAQGAINNLTKSLDWTPHLSPPRFDVFAEMVFNLGIGKFLGFHQTIAAAQSGEYARCAHDMLWNAPGVMTEWYIDIHARAARLSTQMATGIYQV
jgi:lysozyme